VAANREVVLRKPSGGRQIPGLLAGPAPVGPVDRRRGTIEESQEYVAHLSAVGRLVDQPITGETADREGAALLGDVHRSVGDGLAGRVEYPDGNLSHAVLLDAALGRGSPRGVGLHAAPGDGVRGSFAASMPGPRSSTTSPAMSIT